MAKKSRFQMVNRGRKGSPVWVVEDWKGRDGQVSGHHVYSNKSKSLAFGVLRQRRELERKNPDAPARGEVAEIKAGDTVSLRANVRHTCPEGREDNRTAEVQHIDPTTGACHLNRDLHGCQWWNAEDLVRAK